MTLLLAALGVLLVGSLPGLVLPRGARWFGPPALWLAAGLGVVGLLPVLLGGAVETFQAPWDVPGGEIKLRLDALAAVFLLPVLLVPAAVAPAAASYARERSEAGQSTNALWFFLPLFVASMAVVVLARNAVLFLVAWEAMSVAAYFLLTVEGDRPEVSEAGWGFLVAAHLGGACLAAFFVLLGFASPARSFDFDAMAAATLPLPLKHLGFALALLGFGSKAGLVPLHVWLPASYSAAPEWLAALLSGAMSKLGIFGLVLALGLLGPPQLEWAWVLLGAGLLTGLFGVCHALVQHGVRRLLAYSSVENLGLIVLGLGTGLLGQVLGYATPMALGYAAALLHVLNHALVKTLLFLAAGALSRATGTDRIDELGGLMKRLPVLSTAFVVGAVAIAGLPPLNCFASEFLLLLSAFEEELTAAGPATLLPFVLVVAGVALIAGLAVAAFTKAAGLTLLGNPRSPAVDQVKGGAGGWMLVLLAAACLALGLAAPLVVSALTTAVSLACRRSPSEVAVVLDEGVSSLANVALVLGVFLALLVGLAVLRAVLLQGREVGASETWGCGYDRPTSRMQYSGSSYSQPLTELVMPLVAQRKEVPGELPYFPSEARAETETTDLPLEAGYKPAFAGLRAAFGWLRFLQAGTVHVYVLYIAATLLVLLLWNLG